MNPRVATPKIFRRKDKFYVRVQVPKAMQARLGKKEHWISLGTSDWGEAVRIAPNKVSDKRADIARTYNGLMDIKLTITDFSDEQREALLRESYHRCIQRENKVLENYQKSGMSWPEFQKRHEQSVEEVIALLRSNGGNDPNIKVMMIGLQHDNGFTAPPGSPAFNDLQEICISTMIEAFRKQAAMLNGQVVQPNPNPQVVNVTTGKPHEFVPLHELLARPLEEPVNLLKLVDEFIRSPNKLRTEKTKKSIRGSMEVVIEIIGNTTPLESITEEDCERVRDLLMQLPPNFRKLPELRGRTVDDMVTIARRKKLPCLTPTGVNTYLKWLTSFLNWCHRKGKISRLPTSFSEIKVADPERKQDKRQPFSNEQLTQYFGSRVFVASEEFNCLYWVSLIALWNGMRTNEICQLDVADIVCEDNIWGFDITHLSVTGDDDKFVKTDASIRLVPVHPRLIEFGLLDFRASRPVKGKLFEDITRGRDGYYSSTFSKKSNRYLKEVGVHGPKHKFHSFRHNFRDALRRGRVDAEIARALGGWQRGNTDAFEIYGSGFPLEDLYNEIERVDFPCVDWTKFISD